MDKNKAEKLFEEFKNQVADNLHLKRVIEGSTNHHLESLKGVDDENWLENKLINEAFTFKNISEDRSEKFAFRFSNKKELIARIQALHNYQISWLLAWNYEVFESYLKYMNGIISEEYSNVKKEKHLNQMLSNFSNIFPEIKKNEKTEFLGIELRLMIIFISKIRHALVHNKGLISDVSDLFKRIIKDINMYEKDDLYRINEEDKDVLIEFINKNKVSILDWTVNENNRLPLTYEILKILSGCLVSYASLLKDQIR